MRDNATDAGNQQETTSFNKLMGSSETIRRAPLVKRQVIKAYLFGAMHDGTIRENRYRIAQKGTEWLRVIQSLLVSIDYKSWIYQEGRNRDVYILESVSPIFRESFDPGILGDSKEIEAFIRGFFDAEGGIPRSLTAKKYIQLVQKDYLKMVLLKELLTKLSISTGKIHNPSKRVDPNYWRLFVSMPSIPRFVSKVGSWHPRKHAIFQQWMKI